MGTEQETNENTCFTKGLAQTFRMNYTIFMFLTTGAVAGGMFRAEYAPAITL
jgi:hypothetical protein